MEVPWALPMGLHEISESDEKSLDHYEGVQADLIEKKCLWLRLRGRRVEVIIDGET